MDTRRFDLPVAVTLRLQSRSGRIDVRAEPRDDVLVEGESFETREEDAALLVRSGRGGSKPLMVRCPVGTDVVAGTQSGVVKLEGEFGTVSVTTASGAIELERADEADLRTAAGSIKLGACRSRCRMNSMSGKIVGGQLGSASAGTISGSITIDRVGGTFKARSVSGSIDAALSGHGTVTVKTVSGKVHITLPEGTGLQMRAKTMSGRVRNPFPPGDDCFVEAMSVSGSIELVPA
jgi:DUF4097 and DUF4098 domain-containing protein YvlB